MRAIRYISRLFLGGLFIFSGFVKAIDPLGSSYKFSDYFHAFGIDWLDPLSLPLGIFLAGFELVLGLVLILGYQKRRTYWVLLVFMSFFTVLTFILALTNPVSDCGCFGDAIVMTNWQTFFKNLVFMVFVLILFRSAKHAVNVHAAGIEVLLILVFFAGSTILSISALRHLPVIDFRPYDIGTYIPGEMEVPEGAPVDEYETMLYYKNLETGETEEFTLENYPRDTALYEFVTSESSLVSKGYEPPIHDFGIMDPEGFDITDELLSFEGYTLMMISYNLEKAEKDVFADGNLWAGLEKFSGDFRFLPVTASAGEAVEETTSANGIEYEFHSADETMLKTVVRSNPGFVMISNGTIVGKWAWRDFPAMAAWNPEWPELIRQYTEEQDPEIMMLIEEGYMDDMNWEMIDFGSTAIPVLSERLMKRTDMNSWIIFVLSVILLVLLARFVPTRKPDHRG
jgi:uncharacterized membrane protein YphA (DoxX/SURF4 family)